MASQEIAINTSLLNADTSTMDTNLGNVKKSAQEMFDSIKELDSMWEGPAKEAFMAQFNNDYTTLMQISGFLDKFIGCMRYASKEYDNCENSVKDIIATINV